MEFKLQLRENQERFLEVIKSKCNNEKHLRVKNIVGYGGTIILLKLLCDLQLRSCILTRNEQIKIYVEHSISETIHNSTIVVCTVFNKKLDISKLDIIILYDMNLDNNLVSSILDSCTSIIISYSPENNDISPLNLEHEKEPLQEKNNTYTVVSGVCMDTITSDRGANVIRMLQSLLENSERNALIRSLILKNAPNKVLVLTRFSNHMNLMITQDDEWSYIKYQRNICLPSNVVFMTYKSYHEFKLMKSKSLKEYNIIILALPTSHLLLDDMQNKHIIDIVDPNPVFRRHYREREKLYNQSGFIKLEDTA